jgi:hypothetical protein
MGVGGQHHTPVALPTRKTWFPLYRRLSRPQGRSGSVRKISPPPGFDPRTVQPLASSYTDCAIPTYYIKRIWTKKEERFRFSAPNAYCSYGKNFITNEIME